MIGGYTYRHKYTQGRQVNNRGTLGGRVFSLVQSKFIYGGQLSAQTPSRIA
jgi:hypothetical protein